MAAKSHATMEHVEAGWRFTWARGGSFVNVRPVDARTTDVPYDMLALPGWVNVSRLDDEGFRAVCGVWLERQAP